MYPDIGDTATRRPPCLVAPAPRWRVRKPTVGLYVLEYHRHPAHAVHNHRYRRGVRVCHSVVVLVADPLSVLSPSVASPLPAGLWPAVPAHSSDGSRANRIITDTCTCLGCTNNYSQWSSARKIFFLYRLQPPFPVVATNVLQFPSVSYSRSLQCIEVRLLSFKVAFARCVASSNGVSLSRLVPLFSRTGQWFAGFSIPFSIGRVLPMVNGMYVVLCERWCVFLL